MQLRKAKIEDVETIAKILSDSRHKYLPFAKSPYSLDQYRKWISAKLIPSGGVVIVKYDDVDVGVLATSISDKIGWIDQLYLAPGYIRRGIGTELLNHALSFLPRPVRLWTFQQNDRAIRFYEHHGFKAIEYTNGQDNAEKNIYILFELD